jgi:lipoprotein-anchoring transpeptidase ErfK/SrfK
MKPNQAAAYKVLEQAQLALKNRDRIAARQFALLAAQLAPELEEVWLLMAALADPHGSLAFLKKALTINPNSERAKNGMLWAQGRVQRNPDARFVIAQSLAAQHSKASAVNEKPVSVPSMLEESSVQPRLDMLPEPKTTPTHEVVPSVKNKKAITRPGYFFVTLLIIFICLGSLWVGWQGLTPFTAKEHGPAWAQVNISKPGTAQLSVASIARQRATALVPAGETSSGLPALTSTPSSSAGLEPTVSGPASATETLLPPTLIDPAPAETQAPPATPLPTDFAQLTATPDEGSVSQPSPTPLPTDTAAPEPTQFIPPTSIPGSNPVVGRWIDVDLTNQMVYAYEGDTIVNSFLVSTGVPQTPTVTGQYRIYIKYHHADMSGPGYYLPDVPFIMYFFEGYGFHGTYWHNNFGTPMSRGCVNLRIPDSEWIFNFASVGTLVNIHY